jgi:asparaginyl-tRNA synthetase
MEALNMRHLDVCQGNFAKTSQLRAELLSSARNWFSDNSFMEVQVPHITGATGSCEWFPNAMPVAMFDQSGGEINMFLRQTGQLYLEAFTVAHNRVYTIGPSFRQERKVTDRHLCEFTLIEFEGRDFELDGLMDNIESLIKSMYRNAAGIFPSDTLRKYVDLPFNRVAYREAVEILQKNGHKIEAGDDFGSSEEKELCRMLNGMPTFVTHYPSDPRPREGGVIKFFSMKRNNGVTLCCDLLLPNAGESVGGAVREGNSNTCKKQFEESYMYDHLVERGVDPHQFEWYFETLSQAEGQSAGCGIGFERVVQSIIACDASQPSIKAAVEIPRSPDFLTCQGRLDCRGRSLGCPTSLEVGYGPCGRQTPPRVLRNEGSAPLFECYCRGRSLGCPTSLEVGYGPCGRQTPPRVLRNEGSPPRSHAVLLLPLTNGHKWLKWLKWLCSRYVVGAQRL